MLTFVTWNKVVVVVFVGIDTVQVLLLMMLLLLDGDIATAVDANDINIVDVKKFTLCKLLI